MRLSTKLLLTAAAFVVGGAGIYAFAYYLYPPPTMRPAATPARPASPPAVAAPSGPTVAQLFDDCVRGAWPTTKDAEARNVACSKALQTRQLKPPEIALARLTRGIARTMIGDKVLAAEDYSEALKHYDGVVDPRNPDALNLYRRATSLHAVGETDRALSDYSDAIRVDPNNSLGYLGRGVLLATRKRAFNRAIEDFDKVLVLEPDNVDALIARGNAYSQLGDNGRALADLDRAIILAPDDPQAYVIRGLANNRRGEPQLAMQDYNTALQKAPRYPQALATAPRCFRPRATTTRRWPTWTNPSQPMPTIPSPTTIAATSISPSTNMTRRWPTTTTPSSSIRRWAWPTTTAAWSAPSPARTSPPACRIATPRRS